MLWVWLFTEKPPPPDIPLYVIVDELGQWPVDEEYVNHGIEGGWLQYSGCHWLNGQLYFRYIQV